METLDNILSGEGAPVLAPETTKPVEEKPAVVAETPTEPQDEVIEQGGRKMVPLEALTETRGKVKRYTEQVAAFETTLKEREAAWDRRFSELLQTVKQPQPPKEQAPQTDWFENPDVAFRQRGEALLNPVMRNVQTLETRVARFEAKEVFGEKLPEFMAFIADASKKGDPEVKALEAMMESSPQPYAVAKEWFDKRTFDPAAEREKIRAELEAELGHKPAAVQTPVMPSNLAGARNVGTRAGPAWAGPTPLTDIFKR